MNQALEHRPGEIHDRVEAAIGSGIPDQQRRVLKHLLQYPGSPTWEIARYARCSYPPTPISKLNRSVLPRFGLKIVGTPPPPGTLNSAGEPDQVHRWAVVVR